MRRLTWVCCYSVLAVGAAGAVWNLLAGDRVTVSSNPAVVDQSPLIVHEWGTFTNFSGSDGVQLEFRPLAQNDLPGFVLTYRDNWGISFRKWELRAFQRMETPVTYFYTPVERDVQVRVRFPEGLLTEYFPPVVSMTPAHPEDLANAFGGDTFTPATLPYKESLLDWGTVHLIPIESLTTQVNDPLLSKSMGQFLAQQLVPAAAAHPHYVHARETDSALVDVRFDGKNGSAMKGDYFEKFLFYRGLGNFKLPLTLAAHGQGAYQLTNLGPDAIRSLFLVTIHGDDVRFNVYDRVDGNSMLTLVAGAQVSTVEALAEAMAKALTKEGLYRKEADAMVNSWRDSWFAEDGTRLLYMVPRRMTDELLPLQITPQPDEIVRVLVGRMEIMSPEDESRIVELVERSATARGIEQRAATGAASETDNGRQQRGMVFQDVLAMGRLAEPALVRAQHVAAEQAVRNEAAQLIGELRQHAQLQGQ